MSPGARRSGRSAVRYPLKGDPYSSHSIVAGEVKRLAREMGAPDSRVLDVGCGAGSLSTLLAGGSLSLIGIDSDLAALDQARRAGYMALIHADVEASELPPLGNPTDILVCADILEHCRWPEAVLQRLLRRYLRPGGAIIVSLPNVANWYVRGQLLAGRWPYADRGILDRTHLRFFTQASSEALLSDAGVRIQRQHSTPLPLPALWPASRPGRPFYGVHLLSARLTRCWPALLAYQFVYVGRRLGPGVTRDRP